MQKKTASSVATLKRINVTYDVPNFTRTELVFPQNTRSVVQLTDPRI